VGNDMRSLPLDVEVKFKCMSKKMAALQCRAEIGSFQ